MIILNIGNIIYNNAFNVLVTASAIPSFLWIHEFRNELGFRRFWQIALLLAGFYAVGVVSVYGVAALQNLIAGYHWANRCGWPVFVTMPLVYLLAAKLTKSDPKAASDILGIVVMLIFGFGRAACVFQGCCLGKYIPNTNYRWPLVILEVLFIAVCVVICGKKAYERQFNGRSYPVFLIGYGAFRLLLEQFRAVPDGGVIGCIVLIILGAVCLAGLYRSQKQDMIQGGNHND